ncbi:MAG: glycogen-debranching protein, partial [Planctomycetaceae bacterium]|nr:glycogen-debranching protein [Planctomycetaceae bacterium]
FRFFQKMIAFRKCHPSLSRSRFWRDDVAWYGTDRPVDFSAGSKQLAFVLHGATEQDVDIYVLINFGVGGVRFGLHEGDSGEWKRVIDTSRASPADICDPGEEVPLRSHYCYVESRSVVVLIR